MVKHLLSVFAFDMPWADGELVADWWETDDTLDPGGGRLVRVWLGSSGRGLVRRADLVGK